MKFELDMEDFTIIQNALHYYKHVEKRGHFSKFDEERVNRLRDKLSYQMIKVLIVKMELFLRPLADVNDVTWSIIWCLIILLAGVTYYIVYIMRMAFDEMRDE